MSRGRALNTGAIVNARYANAPAKQKGQDLSNVECYTCHKKGHYSNKCSKRQPGGALGTRQDEKPWCSHHQTNTHSSEECWHLHPHLKDQGGGRQKGKGKHQSNARSADAANSGGSGTPSGAQLQEMFAAFMLTQNAASAGPRREDSYSGSVVELKVPVTPMSDTDQTRIRAGATPWRSPTLQARVAAATLTRKGPERQRLAGPQSKMPLGFLQQGPLTSRLKGGGRNLRRTPKKMLRQSAKEQVSLMRPAAPAQQISRPSPFRGPRFSTKDMAEGETSLKKRVTPTKGKKSIPCYDDGDNSWSGEIQAKYQREGVQMVLGDPVTKNIRALVKLVSIRTTARMSARSRAW
jgi:hypothetical protein